RPVGSPAPTRFTRPRHVRDHLRQWMLPRSPPPESPRGPRSISAASGTPALRRKAHSLNTVGASNWTLTRGEPFQTYRERSGNAQGKEEERSGTGGRSDR